MTILACAATVSSIGKPRKAITLGGAIGYLIGSGLGVWALYVWGLRG